MLYGAICVACTGPDRSDVQRVFSDQVAEFQTNARGWLFHGARDAGCHVNFSAVTNHQSIRCDDREPVIQHLVPAS